MLGWFVDRLFANDDIAFGWEKNEGKLKFRIKKDRLPFGISRRLFVMTFLFDHANRFQTESDGLFHQVYHRYEPSPWFVHLD